MKKMLIVLLALSSISLHAMDRPSVVKRVLPTKDPLAEELFKEVAPGVFAGQAQVGNETVYFGMERIDQGNKDQWKTYANTSNEIIKDYGNNPKYNLSNGILYVLARRAAGLIDDPTVVGNRKSEIGFSSKEEFTNFMKVLKQRFQNDNNYPQKIKAISGGINGFELWFDYNKNYDGNYYVAYVSKVPVTGPSLLPKEFPGPISLVKFYNLYKNIIMSVGAKMDPGAGTYENRGIFKNPMSFVLDEKTYPGLSMRLHGFTAAVAQHLLNKENRLIVRPLSVMTEIILKAKKWERGEIMINGKDFLDYTPQELTKIKKDNAGGIEPTISLRVDTLIKFYKG